MKKIQFSLVAMMLAKTLFAFGGCGGGSSGGDTPPKPKQEITLSLDSDKDGYPDVFDDYPLDAARWSWGVNAEDADAPLGTHNTQATAVGVSSPMKVPFSIIGKIKSPDVTKDIADIDHYAFELARNRQYSVVLYDITGILHRAYLGAGPSFIPAVSVIAKGASESLPITVNTSAATDSSVVLSFTPQKSGIYYLSIANTEGTAQPGEDYTYAFDFVEDNEGDGQSMYFVGTGDNGKPFRYSFNDVHFLRTSLLPSVTEVDKNGFPTKYNPVSADILWKQALDVVNYEHILVGQAIRGEDGAIITAAGDTSELMSQILGVRWRDEIFGAGPDDVNAIDAVTGMPSSRIIDAPIKNFVIPNTPMARKSETTVKYISSTNEQEQEESIGVNCSLGISGLSLGISSEYKHNLKYSQTSTTIVVKYVVKEDGFRKLRNSNYSLTDSAVRLFKEQGADAFRARHGDYFVAGFKKGASFTATVAFNTSSTEELEEVKRTLNLGFSSGSDDIKAAITNLNKMKKSGKNIDITVEAFTHGGPEGFATNITLDNVMDKLGEFAKGVTIDNMGKIEAALLHYGQVDNGEGIGNVINVSNDLFLDTRKMMNAYTTLTAAFDTIVAIPVKHLKDQQGGAKEDMINRYNALTTEFQINQTAIASNLALVNEWTNKFLAMRAEYRIFIERYTFFKNLMKARWAMPKSTGAGENIVASGGYQGYSLSSAVDNDIDKWFRYDETMAAKYEINEHIYRHFIWDAGADRRLCYIRTHAEHNQDSFTDDTYPSIGRRAFDFLGKGPKNQGVRWNMKAKTISVGANWVKYPFNWDYYADK